MKKQKLSLQQLKISSFITDSKLFDKQTVKGGDTQTFEEGICYSLNDGCGGNQTEYTVCAKECRCPMDIPTFP